MVDRHLMPDPAYTFTEILSQFAIAAEIGWLRGKSTGARQFRGEQRHGSGGSFWRRRLRTVSVAWRSPLQCARRGLYKYSGAHLG
ncbi:MAG: hypothetical protein AAGD09_17720 [Cyanobacteria bacterium P01_F01_bin.56]